MIEKMSYINIMGSISDIDRVVEHYITKYPIQLEYTEKELSSSAKLSSCIDENPYGLYLEKAEKLAQMAGFEYKQGRSMDKDEAMNLINDADVYFQIKDENLKELEGKKKKYELIIDTVEPFVGLDFDVADFREFEFICYRYGKMPLSNYRQFESYLYERSEILFIESKRDNNYIYFVYFVPVSLKDKVDAMFSSLNFEGIHIPLNYEEYELRGSPYAIYKSFKEKLVETQQEIGALQSETLFTLGINKQDTIDAYYSIYALFNNYSLRRYAAKTEDNFYIFVGWMSKRDAFRLARAAEADKKVVIIIEEDDAVVKSRTPTKLKNNILFKPFEFFVRTYGLPKYNELDPTPFVAVTYIILFGLMFGDLGQGAVISLLGMYLHKKKGLELGGVMSIIGLSSMFFGLMYGSVFGMEELIPALWLKPSEHINQVLVMAVGAGAVLILIAMVLNIVNSVKQKNMAKLLLSPSGIAGMVFYIGVIGIVLAALFGNMAVTAGLIVLFIGVPLVIIAFREPIEKILKKERHVVEGSIPMFLLETVIELFEVLLTYFTNTVSFVRVGAFALSHAGMMSVVLLLAERPEGGYSLPVMVFGNLLVMGMEGLVVGIQVLRIEFYELFSRYYEGGGRDFSPVSQEADNK